MKNTTQTYKNKHGRKQTRGIRPFLLIPKLIAVSCMLGGLVSLLVVGLTESYGLPSGFKIIMIRVIIPASTVTIILGIALLALHGRPLLRMRWVIAKIIIVFTCLPLAHLLTRYCYLKYLSHQALLSNPYRYHVAMEPTWINLSLAFTICVVIALLWLGRHKPRLNQKVGPPRK